MTQHTRNHVHYELARRFPTETHLRWCGELSRCQRIVDRLRVSKPALHVLYTSGHPAEALADLDEAQRCQPFVQKPVDP
jgi:hypothetical protein